MKKVAFILLFILPFFAFSQKKGQKRVKDDFVIIKNDSLTIPLDEVIVFDKKHFDSSKEKRYYYWYYKKVHKAYPYAKMASEILVKLNDSIAGIKSKWKKKKMIKKMQKYLEGEFTDELKKMTRTEGRILIKLIHRQTGETLFNLIKDYRSGFKAFWYNTSAKLFKLNLKNEYHPESIPLDFLVEDILQRSFADATLEYQEPKYPIDYFKLKEQWKNIKTVDVIDEYIQQYK
ncbi:MAG: DUF4294 domain-containing protein [Flavobacteriia bacterium]|nr:MAG: DUF4294 domain-containing protein [Flavobacteriia bacterium]